MTYHGADYFTATAAPSPLQHTWSLGIEEQFYLLWPLVVGILLWLGRTRTGAAHRRAPGRPAPTRTVLAGLALAGAAASAVCAALLFAPQDVNRAYYGTDTRAGALLVGCALAVALALRGDRSNRRVCPGGTFTWQIGSLRIRSDGLHFTPEGVQQWMAPWLLPQLTQLAIRGP